MEFCQSEKVGTLVECVGCAILGLGVYRSLMSLGSVGSLEYLEYFL